MDSGIKDSLRLRFMITLLSSTFAKPFMNLKYMLLFCYPLIQYPVRSSTLRIYAAREEIVLL